MSLHCPFCRFQDERALIYQDSLSLAVVSREPINPFHVLVFPREHYVLFTELPDSVAGHLFQVAKRLSKVVASLSEADWVTHLSDDDLKGSGVNLVAHYKLHIIPRYRNDAVVMEWNRREDPDHARQYGYAERLRGAVTG